MRNVCFIIHKFPVVKVQHFPTSLPNNATDWLKGMSIPLDLPVMTQVTFHICSPTQTVIHSTKSTPLWGLKGSDPNTLLSPSSLPTAVLQTDRPDITAPSISLQSGTGSGKPLQARRARSPLGWSQGKTRVQQGGAKSPWQTGTAQGCILSAAALGVHTLLAQQRDTKACQATGHTAQPSGPEGSEEVQAAALHTLPGSP